MRSLIRSASRAMSKPTTRPLPLVGSRIPHSMRMVVDFPAPLGPGTPKISPARPVPGIVDAHAHPDRQVRALAAAEQVARRELGAARDPFDLARELVRDGVDAEARGRPDA